MIRILEKIFTRKGISRKVRVSADTAIVEKPVHGGPLIPATRRKPMEVAIIGLAGSYPDADNVDQLWENIKAGKDSVREVPRERWDHSAYFCEQKNTAGKTYSKWGGFLPNVAHFDPGFFNISSREAEVMDPQERLFMQCAYSAIEDAGYTRQALSKVGNVAVYVGVQYSEYTFYSNTGTTVGALPACIANRLSFFCDFRGPSVAIDSMCSSSLATIHMACQSLELGEAAYAIAGGVNISIHPNKFLLHAQGQFSSSTGRCRSFGQRADGYVPAEGVGAILLKPLANAIADNDHIYGVIKSTAINHGGRASGFTMPKSAAQTRVIRAAIERAGIDPRDISCVEAHGTGTVMGDLIEIEGLKNAYFQGISNPDKQYCAIGSIKSNIGHCESAAGIASLTKVLLQLKHRQLAPSLHSQELNRNIDFASSPFYVPQKLEEWKNPLTSGKSGKPARIAGVSSFGAGGSNAHIIVEEYIDQSTPDASSNQDSPQIIVLSARNKERLLEYAASLLSALRRERKAPTTPHHTLRNIAYTLQTGREAMKERMGFVTSSLLELESTLDEYVNTGGNTTRVSTTEADTSGKEQRAKKMQAALAGKQYNDVVRCWVDGADVDWTALAGSVTGRRISLPTYPFAREVHWVPEAPSQPPSGNMGNDKLHPLLHKNTSTFSVQRFTSEFTGNEFFLDHHRIHGKFVLPGVAYLEMAYQAVSHSIGADLQGSTIRLKDIVWIRPFTGDPTLTLHIELSREKNNSISFEFYTVHNRSEVDSIKKAIYCRGSAEIADIDARQDKRHDLDALRLHCHDLSSGINHYYDQFSQLGISYGIGHRGLAELYISPDLVLAKLSLPSSLRNSSGLYCLHPCLLDASLQASLAFTADEKAKSHPSGPTVPFTLQELVVSGDPRKITWALLRASPTSSANGHAHLLDLDLCDESGAVCVQLKQYGAKILPATSVTATSTDARPAFAEPSQHIG